MTDVEDGVHKRKRKDNAWHSWTWRPFSYEGTQTSSGSTSSAATQPQVERPSSYPGYQSSSPSSLGSVAEVDVVQQGCARKLRKSKMMIRSSAQATIGRDGRATRVAERVPVVNNVVWAVHRMRGHLEQANRASTRNPMGTNGFITKTAECIPGVSDAIRYIHQQHGEEEAAERARGNSLTRYLGKDGAITKTAELLPGSNLVAALILETSGNHEDAKKALNIFRHWRNVGTADGALTKLAEMFPGTDLIAFGLYASHDEFAYALRSVAKTRWVDLTSSQVLTCLDLETVDTAAMSKFDVGDFSVHPIATPLIGALLDLASKILFSEGSWIQTLHITAPLNLSNIEETVVNITNEIVDRQRHIQLSSVPSYLMTAVDTLTDMLKRKRTNVIFRALLPERIPAPSHVLTVAVQRAIPAISVVHVDSWPGVRGAQPRYNENYGCGLPEAAGAVSCLSFTGCIGFGCHTGLLGCFAGCAAVLTQVVRKVSTAFVPWVDKHNESAQNGCKAMTRSPSESDMASTSRGAIFTEVPDIPHLVELITEYVMDSFLRSWRVGLCCRKLLSCIGPPLRAFFSGLVGEESGRLQVAFNVSVPSQHVPVDHKDQELDIPAIPLLILVDMHLAGQGPLFRRLRVVLPDSVVGHVISRVSSQVSEIDWRLVDRRLDGFVEPLEVKFDLALEWVTEHCPQIDVRNFVVRLHLPG